MTKKLFTAIAIFFSAGASFAQNFDNLKPDPALIEEAKKAATRASGGLPNQAVQIDAQGNVVLDANGNPVQVKKSAGTVGSDLRYFNNITGVEGVSQDSNPARSGRTAQATIKLNQFFDISCKAIQTVEYRSVSSLGLALSPCTFENSSVSTIPVKLCDKFLKAGVCDSIEDYTVDAVLRNGSFTNINGSQFGLGCDANQNCRISVKGSYTAGGNDASLKQQAANVASESTLVGSMGKIVSDGTYSREFSQNTKTLLDCGKLNENAANTGEYYNCDGTRAEAVVTSKTSENKAECSKPPVCLKESTSSFNFKKSCVRTFPLTERTSSFKYDKTLTCTISRGDESSDSCIEVVQEEDLEKGLEKITRDNREGYSKVGESSESCSKSVEKEDGSSSCVQWTKSEFYVDLSSKSNPKIETFPSAIGGACDVDPNSSTRDFRCPSNNWFGRTLPPDQCIVEFETDGDDTDAGFRLFDYTNKPGCGICLEPNVGETCYGTSNPNEFEIENGADQPDSCQQMDLAGCSLESSSAIAFSGEDSTGLVIAQEEVYSCSNSSTQCVQWSSSADNPECSSVSTLGLDQARTNAPAADASLNDALVSAALTDGFAQGMDSSKPLKGTRKTCRFKWMGICFLYGDEQFNVPVPLLFEGEDMRCKRPVSLGGVVQKNCCRTNLERPKEGNIIQGGCNMEHVKLAAARRSSYAHYIGDYCSRRLPWPLKTCIERKQTYCVFPGILPKLIHQQGRSQLAKMLSSSSNASIQRQNTSFSYYSPSEQGSWSPVISVNGVSVSAWQWPSYCADPEKAAEKLLLDNSAKLCPGVVTTWFAACDATKGCGALPSEPEDGAIDWTLTQIDPLSNSTTAVSKYASVTGACSPSSEQCTYQISAWPVGIGGKAIVSKELIWQFYGDGSTIEDENVDPYTYQMNNVGDLMFKLYSIKGVVGSELPANVLISLSTDGGQNWKFVELPTTSLENNSLTIPGTDVTITGSCEKMTSICSFKATATATVTAKSWGGPKGPDCSGFTAGQLAIMDFSKMDLSEWTSSVIKKIGNGADPAQMAEQATVQVQQFNAAFQQGKVAATPPVASNFAKVLPAEGFGPFTATLSVSGMWPEYTESPDIPTEKVTSVRVNWGDCTVEQSMPRHTEGDGFRMRHEYKVPNHSSHGCLKLNGSDKLQRNISHEITLKIQTVDKAGAPKSYTRKLYVENAWSRFPGADSNNVMEPLKVEKETPQGQSPLPPGAISP